MGLPICLTSDAHSARHLMYAFDRAAGLARSCGYEECMYLTRTGVRPRPAGPVKTKQEGAPQGAPFLRCRILQSGHWRPVLGMLHSMVKDRALE